MHIVTQKTQLRTCHVVRSEILPTIGGPPIVGKISLRTTCTQLRFLRHNMHNIGNKPLADVA